MTNIIATDQFIDYNSIHKNERNKKIMIGKVYIYNKKQKDFYIKEGCKLLDSDMHKVTKKIYWVFAYDDVQDAFKKWCLRKH